MSQQIRLYYTALKNEAERFYTLIETAFDEEGYPLALTEIDEQNAVYELSLYVDQDNHEKTLKRFASILSIDSNKINHEILPDIDWVQKSLEGLKPIHAGPFFFMEVTTEMPFLQMFSLLKLKQIKPLALDIMEQQRLV